jgi:AcrR family transcriptional regulator
MIVKRSQIVKKSIKKPTQKRSRETVAAIFAATTHILVKCGWEYLTTNAIAERAGISIGSLYQYFPNKLLIVQELIDQMFSEEDRVMARILDSIENLDIETSIQRFVSGLIEIHRKNPALRNKLYELTPLVGKADRRKKHQELSFHQLIAFLDKKNMTFRNSDLKMAVFILQHAVEAVILGAIDKNPRMLDDSLFVDELARLISNHLLQDF